MYLLYYVQYVQVPGCLLGCKYVGEMTGVCLNRGVGYEGLGLLRYGSVGWWGLGGYKGVCCAV